MTHEEAIEELRGRDPALSVALAHNDWCVDSLKREFAAFVAGLPNLIKQVVRQELEAVAAQAVKSWQARLTRLRSWWTMIAVSIAAFAAVYGVLHH